MKTKVILSLLSLLIAVNSNAQLSQMGGGDLNPELKTDQMALKKFLDMRVGLSIHWGPSSIGGEEISWSRDKEIPKEVYDNYYKLFNPVNFNANEWVQLAIDGGMKYISLTSKHHDGFSLWPTAYSEYDIASTPFGKDIVWQLSVACQSKGVVFGSYYSIIDWYHADYQPYSHGGPGKLSKAVAGEPDFENYIAYMKNQLQELVEVYGAEFIQFDGEWEETWNHERGSDLYRFMKNLDPGVLVNNRVDVGRQNHDEETNTWNWKVYAGDFEERERMVEWVGRETEVHGRSKVPWQAWVTIDKAQWSYNETPKLLSAEEIIIDLLTTIGDNGNYLINLGPRPDGTFHPEQVETIREVGSWLKSYAEGIYGTRGGPFAEKGRYTSTKKGKEVFVFVLDAVLKDLRLKTDSYTIQAVTNYQGEAQNFEIEEEETVIDLKDLEESGVRVLRLKI